MELKCRSCGSKSCIVKPKRELEKVTGSSVGMSGKIDASILDGLFALLASIFEWFKDNDQKYVVCKKCGYFEKLQ